MLEPRRKRRDTRTPGQMQKMKLNDPRELTIYILIWTFDLDLRVSVIFDLFDLWYNLYLDAIRMCNIINFIAGGGPSIIMKEKLEEAPSGKILESI